ncbi:hypothetical protein DPEC_G00204690 [Dallia pectoralis]|uniref:Uncharacterized protein n=1 Tax=Dallia pectoralis TaxID=75939 RepID=A0ACC2G460_DALPE|nr:hypothetical protein DPEC_G00204690 [Dallia pectoralis]
MLSGMPDDPALPTGLRQRCPSAREGGESSLSDEVEPVRLIKSRKKKNKKVSSSATVAAPALSDEAPIEVSNRFSVLCPTQGTELMAPVDDSVAQGKGRAWQGAGDTISNGLGGPRDCCD